MQTIFGFNVIRLTAKLLKDIHLIGFYIFISLTLKEYHLSFRVVVKKKENIKTKWKYFSYIKTIPMQEIRKGK